MQFNRFNLIAIVRTYFNVASSIDEPICISHCVSVCKIQHRKSNDWLSKKKNHAINDNHIDWRANHISHAHFLVSKQSYLIDYASLFIFFSHNLKICPISKQNSWPNQIGSIWRLEYENFKIDHLSKWTWTLCNIIDMFQSKSSCCYYLFHWIGFIGKTDLDFAIKMAKMTIKDLFIILFIFLLKKTFARNRFEQKSVFVVF